MESKKVETLILGGGVTGLATASFLSGEYSILEKEDQPGGYCKTSIKNGFVWDYSGHFFHFKNDYIKNYIVDGVDCDILNIKKISKIFYKGEYIDFPFQYNVDQLSKEEFIECLHDLYQQKIIDKTTFKSYVRSSLGNSIADKFIIPYNEKLYSCDLDNLDYDSMGRFFPPMITTGELLDKIRNKKSIISYNETFVYPVKGVFEFIKSLLKKVNKSCIKTSSEVKKIDLKNKLVYLNNIVYSFDNLVNTLPFNTFLKLCGKNEKSLSYNKVIVFNLGFDSKSLINSHWVYFPGKEVFYRVGFYDNILSQDRMSLYVEIGMAADGNVDESCLLQNILLDLMAVGIVTTHKLIEHEMLVMSPAYVHINNKSKQVYTDWCEEYNRKGIYSIGRYGSWTYCSIEDNIIEGKKVAEIINNKQCTTI